MDPLAVRLVENGAVYPTIRVASHPGKLLMGVFDEHGTYVEDTALNRRAGEQGAPTARDLFPTVTAADLPEAIYAGPLYFHFGHFLLESLARAWYAARHPDVPLVWAGQHDWQQTQLRPWQTQILDSLGITNPMRIIADPTRFDTLHIPDLGYRYDDRFHPDHADFLGRYNGPAQLPGERLWLSRSRLANDARDLNAEPTERRLAKAGWTIVHPETLGISEQLDHLARAEIVAGEEGSAFHALVLLQDVAAKRFHIFRRHGREHGNLHTIGNARRLDQTFYSLHTQRVLKADGRWVTKVSPNASEILDSLDVPVPTTGASAPTAVDERLRRNLADLRPQRYLEVGAADPGLVVGSTAPVRVAVAPRFDIDPRRFAGSGVDFYELGLNQYADLFHEDREPFDVIRIAGRTYADVMASFTVSQPLADSRTIWILGSGPVAARAAVAIQSVHPGFTARRRFGGLRSVYLAQRVSGEPTDDEGVGKLSEPEVRRRARWLPVTRGRREQHR